MKKELKRLDSLIARFEELVKEFPLAYSDLLARVKLQRVTLVSKIGK